MTPNTDRVISIALSDEDWRAFMQVQPEPVSWLKARIHETIETSRSTSPSQPSIGRA
ncbi:MAG: hypothetical protein ABI880_12795 [Acidobacteriota bacterium]